jgi:hypothetical protein
VRLAEACIVAASLVATPAATAPSLKQWLTRIGAYVERYGEQASIVVASERYTQHVTSDQPGVLQGRRTVAEFAIVKTASENRWVGFRDVIEVDGKPQTDHNHRLVALLTSAGGADEARDLSEESARFNIGPVQRNFNVPTTALFFFAPANFDRFKFSLKEAAADGAAEIGFRETYKPTFVRSPKGEPISASGSIWVNADGTITRTLMHLAYVNDVGRILLDVDVVYALVPALGMWLPRDMTEIYEVRRAGANARIDCHAEYSNYRTFQTSVRIK